MSASNIAVCRCFPADDGSSRAVDLNTNVSVASAGAHGPRDKGRRRRSGPRRSERDPQAWYRSWVGDQCRLRYPPCPAAACGEGTRGRCGHGIRSARNYAGGNCDCRSGKYEQSSLHLSFQDVSPVSSMRRERLLLGFCSNTFASVGDGPFALAAFSAALSVGRRANRRR